MSNVYNEDNIRTLDIVTAIRLNPDMYIDGIGELGLFKLDCEAVQNLIDEFLVGRCTKGIITYDSSRGYIRVEDDGAGIPLGKLEDIFTKAHTGGKFDRNAYAISGGKNGTGAKAIAALSSHLKVEVWRQGYVDNEKNVPPMHGWMEFKLGKKVNEFVEEVPNSTKHGTTVEYITDDSVMMTNKRNVLKFKEYLETTSFINSGIYLEYRVDGEKNVYYHTGGIPEFLETIIKRKKLKPVVDTVALSGEGDMFWYNIAFTYHHLNSGDGNIMSSVNGFKTAMHGSHVSAFRAGASLALTDYIKENDDLIPKTLKNVNMSGTLISDNIIAIVSVKHKRPLYTGQTKDMFKSEDVIEPIKQMTRRVFGKWLRDNPQQAKKLVNIMIDYAKYEEERKKLKKNLIETKAVKSAFASNGIDPTKYTTCRSNNPEEKELFIVEGESAGGNVELAQDRQFQALYCLTGKILNTIKSGNMSKVILELIQALGMGLPGNGAPNYKNLQYHKIIILTDADDDGAHIATLLLAFLYKYYPKVIEDSHVFIANPPLKKLTMSNGKYFYIHTDKDYDRLMSEFIVEIFDMYSEKTKKLLSKGLFSEFIYHCRGYDILLKNHANSLAMNPDLLELIVVYINILTQCTGNINDKFNKQFKQSSGYDVRRDNEYYTFDKGVYHANLKMDLSFIEHHFDEISNKLNEIMIYGVYLKGKRSGKEYHGTIYTLLQIMNAILGPKIDIQRYKGLGEQSLEDLRETVIDPTTRWLTQVSMTDAEKADAAMQIFMSDANIKFKRLYYAGKVDFE